MIPNMNISRYMIAAVVVWAGLSGALEAAQKHRGK
jgi:hypothetical protein